MTDEKLEEVSSYYGKVLCSAFKVAYGVMAIGAFKQGYYIVPLKRKPKDRSFIRQCRYYQRIKKRSDVFIRSLWADCELATLRFGHRVHLFTRKVRVPANHYIKYSVLCLIHKMKGR